MPYYTPLRYPGGKRRLVRTVARLLDENRLSNIQYAEPYAGGASIALALLFDERAADVHINDLSRPVYAFWRCVLDHNAELCQRIAKIGVTMAEWRRQRAVYEDRERADVLDLGFSTLFLNRTNRSGIIGGGVIGGKDQTGAWKIDARFTKDELVTRIKRIGRYRSRIHLYQSDALQFTEAVVANLGRNSFAFYDPPYIENGQDLYLNNYDIEGHHQLAIKIGQLEQPWVVTYDAAAISARLYPTIRRIVYGLSYTAQGRYDGREVMFLSDHVSVPAAWRRGTFELSRLPASKVNAAVYGKMENMKRHSGVEEDPAGFENSRKPMEAIVAVHRRMVASEQRRPRPKQKKPATRKR